MTLETKQVAALVNSLEATSNALVDISNRFGSELSNEEKGNVELIHAINKKMIAISRDELSNN